MTRLKAGVARLPGARTGVRGVRVRGVWGMDGYSSSCCTGAGGRSREASSKTLSSTHDLRCGALNVPFATKPGRFSLRFCRDCHKAGAGMRRLQCRLGKTSANGWRLRRRCRHLAGILVRLTRMAGRRCACSQAGSLAMSVRRCADVAFPAPLATVPAVVSGVRPDIPFGSGAPDAFTF